MPRRDKASQLKRARAMLISALRSDNANEAFNALGSVRRWLKANKVDAEDFLEQVTAKPPPILGTPLATFENWAEQVQFIDGSKEGYLSDRELGFIVGLREKPAHWVPSTKQRNWLQSIYMRLQLVSAYQQAKE